MSTKSLRQLSRAKLDRAITETFAKLPSSGVRRLAFDNLLNHARARSTLLQVGGDGSAQVLAVEALFNISRWHREFSDWPSTWAGGDGSVYSLILSLAAHLFGGYSAPPCFAQIWFGGESPDTQQERRWFIEHVRGRRFRDVIGLPLQMTRNMERLLIHSPHHLPLRAAMRRAEVLALGGEPELVEAILATPLARRFDNGEFWRSAIRFLVRYWDEIGPTQVAEYIDRLDAVRHRPLRVWTHVGTRILPPPDPTFSLAGRTPKTVLREIAQRIAACVPIHEPLPEAWGSLELPDFSYIDGTGHWRMFELCDRASLGREGATMRHCVGSYWQACVSGRSSIWSLRILAEGRQEFASRCTVEVSPRTRTVVQIRGPQNQPVNAKVRALIERWIAQTGLALTDDAWPIGQASLPVCADPSVPTCKYAYAQASAA